MLIAEARQQAKAWVEREASPLPGFLGAFLTGSTKWKRRDEIHSASSDVDVRVVLDGSAGSRTWQKSRYREILLEAAAVTRKELGSADEILLNPFLAGSLWHPVLVADPSGELAELGSQVTSEFARRTRVEKRAKDMLDLALLWLRRIEEGESFPVQVTCWAFGTSATTLVLLAAGLRNLTVRRRFAECRALLEEHGRLAVHEEMLSWMGCEEMPAERVQQHLDRLSEAFDACATHLDPAFRFAADLRPDARSIAIEGSRELIVAKRHREAVFWLVATYSRCLQGLRSQAPERVRSRCDAGLRELLRDLGIEDRTDLNTRAERVRAGVPLLEATAAELIGTNADVVD